MNADIFVPAQPGFYVIEVPDDDETYVCKYPVVAWRMVPDECEKYIAEPVTAQWLLPECTTPVLHPDGQVTDVCTTWPTLEAFVTEKREEQRAAKRQKLTHSLR
jgi:hypothetical protein